MRLTLLSRRRDRQRSRGQSLVELALIAPVLLIILLLAVDFGRAFYSWVILQNASRIGANFVGLNAQAWRSDPDIPTTVAAYEALIEEDVANAACTDLGPLGPPKYAPAFVDSADTSSSGQTPDTTYDVGDSVRVSIDCVFHPLTPIVSAIVSNNVTLGATSEFRIRAGDIAGLDNPARIPPPVVATPTPVPTPTPTGTACTATAAITRTPSGALQSGDTATFTLATTTSPGCTIASYAWTFPQGTPTTTSGPGPHTIAFATTVNVTVDVSVTVTTNTGSTATDTESVRINR